MHHHEGHGHPFAFLWSLEVFLEEYLVTKAPFQLPVGAKEFLVKVLPYLVVIFLVMSLPGIFMLFGRGSFLGGIALPDGLDMMSGVRTMMFISGIFVVLIALMEIIALPGLFAKARKGRNWLYYAQILSFFFSILTSNIFGAIIGAVIGMYILFQVRAYYK